MSAAAVDPVLFSTEETSTLTFTVCVVFAVLVVVVSTARILTRVFFVRQWGLDDSFTVLALLMTTTYTSIIAVSTKRWGVGHHAGPILTDNAKYQSFMKFYYGATLGYLPCVFVLKLSIISFLLRIFPDRTLRRITFWLIGFLVVFTVSNEICIMLQCIPIRYMWDKTIAGGHCYTPNQYFSVSMMQSVVVFVTDFFVLALPLPSIWRMNLRLKKKVLLCCLFCVGLFACASSIVRFGTIVFFKDSSDATYGIAKALMWSVIEYSLGMITASIPALHVLVGRRRRFLRSGHDTPAANDGSDANKGSATRLKNLAGYSHRYGYKNETLIEATIQGNESQERIIDGERNETNIVKTIGVTQESHSLEERSTKSAV